MKTILVPLDDSAIAERALLNVPQALITMATHGNTGVRRWALDSNANKALHASATPLLVRAQSQALDLITRLEAATRCRPSHRIAIVERSSRMNRLEHHHSGPWPRVYIVIAVLAALAVVCPAQAAASVRLVKDINPSLINPSSLLNNLTALGSTLLFAADDGVRGWELWNRQHAALRGR
jgi:hypothetical protein